VFWLVPVERCHQSWETPCIPAVNVANKPLTASSKRLKEMELALLEVLMDLDDAVDLLVDLWMREPEDTAAALRQMEQHCSPGLVQEE
jgi:hypothetical protein